MTGKYIILPTYRGERGALSVAQELKEAPFEIRRAFFIYDVPADAHRGCHAYRHNELIVCVHGACRVMIDDGAGEEIFELNDPATALLIPENTWRDIYDFAPGAVLAVVSDALFSDKDYVWDREEFKRMRSSDRN